MLFSTWITFFTLTILATGSPGPNSILALSNGLYYGHKRALFTVAGSLIGLLLLFITTLLGLYTAFQKHPIVFSVISSIGILYMVYIGINKIKKSRVSFLNDEMREKRNDMTNKFLFKEGFLVAISNPKIILFFSIFFTPFISIQDSWHLQVTILACTFFFCEIFWQLIYTRCGEKLNDFFHHQQHYVIFNKITGGFFIGSACFIGYTLHWLG
jgi:threonine/homoserine/homoserine lactone efflux protein